VALNPEDLLYNETHEWLHIQDDGGSKVGIIGISQFAVEQLNDLVYIELPESGKEVTAGGEFGEVESVKAVSPLYSPIAGEIVEVNRALSDSLEPLSDDPYGAGWIIKVRISDDSSLSKLLKHTAYQKQCEAEQ
jgi:glycine cleavage system H protein